MPTLSITVKHNDLYVSNGRVFRWNAIEQRGELVTILDGTN